MHSAITALCNHPASLLLYQRALPLPDLTHHRPGTRARRPGTRVNQKPSNAPPAPCRLPPARRSPYPALSFRFITPAPPYLPRPFRSAPANSPTLPTSQQVEKPTSRHANKSESWEGRQVGKLASTPRLRLARRCRIVPVHPTNSSNLPTSRQANKSKSWKVGKHRPLPLHPALATRSR